MKISEWSTPVSGHAKGTATVAGRIPFLPKPGSGQGLGQPAPHQRLRLPPRVSAPAAQVRLGFTAGLPQSRRCTPSTAQPTLLPPPPPCTPSPFAPLPAPAPESPRWPTPPARRRCRWPLESLSPWDSADSGQTMAFPSAWVSGAGLIQRCFSISLTPHCPLLITEMLMSCLAWKWFLYRGSDDFALIGGGGGAEEPIYQNSHENSPLSS
jgi:hypothetical protein